VENTVIMLVEKYPFNQKTKMIVYLDSAHKNCGDFNNTNPSTMLDSDQWKIVK